MTPITPTLQDRISSAFSAFGTAHEARIAIEHYSRELVKRIASFKKFHETECNRMDAYQSEVLGNRFGDEWPAQAIYATDDFCKVEIHGDTSSVTIWTDDYYPGNQHFLHQFTVDAAWLWATSEWVTEQLSLQLAAELVKVDEYEALEQKKDTEGKRALYQALKAEFEPPTS